MHRIALRTAPARVNRYDPMKWLAVTEIWYYQPAIKKGSPTETIQTAGGQTFNAARQTVARTGCRRGIALATFAELPRSVSRPAVLK